MVSLDSTVVHDGVSAQRSAGTPSLIREAMFQAAAALEFSRVLEVVAEYAAGPLGSARIRARRPSADGDWVRAELIPLGELLECYARGNSVDVAPVPDLSSILDRLRLQGSVLEGSDLVSLRSTLVAIRTTVTELKRIGEEAPTVASWAVPLPDRNLEKKLTQSLDDSGEVLDTASPALLKARREVQAARTRLVRKLEAVLKGSGEVTMRNGRYVIPVRRDSRSRPEGIVHDESATGETLFLEPAAAIELGNQLRGAMVDAERELLRVLRDLTAMLRPQADLIASGHALCVALDDLNARARYAVRVRGKVPTLRDHGEGITLVQARHPLLLSRGIETIPFDLDLTGGERTLLISGPNAGGKTVLLKTAGLITALVQSGIVPPIETGSGLPVFERIVADIGDHQSIAADLSTFSAHLVVLRDLLCEAGPETLVLIDEIGSGTDPVEGGALAAAALRSLTRRGALTIATTHLGSLKALATQTAGIVNGSLQFDPDRLAPTFRFEKGTPGRSYGLAIARRLGVPHDVLTDAESRVPSAERSLDALLEAAERRERQIAADQAKLTARLAEAEQEATRLASERTVFAAREKELQARERAAEQRARSDARRIMMDARSQVEEAVRVAQHAANDSVATEARRKLEDAIRQEGDLVRRLAEEREPGTGSGPIRVGLRVRLQSGGTGRVMELREDGKVLVAAGDVKLVASPEEIVVLDEVQVPRSKVQGETALHLAPRTSDLSEVDLRGMRVDEAEAVALTALDAAVLEDLPYLRIIHGMGTGALKEVVRRLLSADRRVSRFSPAAQNQGGAGVTVAELAP